MAWMSASLLACAPRLKDPERFTADAGACPDVQTGIFWQRCVDAGCHAPGEPAAGLELLTAGVEQRLAGVEATTCLGELLIDEQQPERSFLLTRLSPSPTCGNDDIERMPLTGTLLSEEELACVSRWIERVAARQRDGTGAR